MPDGNATALHFPLLKQLSLLHVTISESSLHALLAGCPVLQSLLLSFNSGCRRLRIVSRSLRSIGVHPAWGDCRLQQLILEDAPSLERLLYFSSGVSRAMDISVISAPKLDTLGPLDDDFPRLDFGATVFQVYLCPRFHLHENFLGWNNFHPHKEMWNPKSFD